MSHDPIARVIFSNEQLTFCCDDLHRSLDRPVSRHARLEDRRSEQLAVQQVAKSHASLVFSALIPLHAFDALARSLEARIRSLAGGRRRVLQVFGPHTSAVSKRSRGGRCGLSSSMAVFPHGLMPQLPVWAISASGSRALESSPPQPLLSPMFSVNGGGGGQTGSFVLWSGLPGSNKQLF